MNEADKLFSDNPIESVEEDTLSRLATAKIFAQEVLRQDASKGMVVGVFGPWGSGKTSFINLAQIEFEENGISVVEFNPWMFSDSQQLVERFFTEISSHPNMPRFGDIDIAKEFKLLALEFAKYFVLAIGGSIVNPLMKRWDAYNEQTEAREQNEGQSIINRRKRIEDALIKLGQGGEKDTTKPKVPIVVIVDDVDRLSDIEISEVFRLVRLTASFPNIIYIVPCDRSRVEKALSNTYGVGRDFLEKIIQFGYNLPSISQSMLASEIDHSIKEALSTVENKGSFDREMINEVLIHIVYPLIRSIRNVRRYAMAIRSTFFHLDGKIAQSDVLALEAIRLFIPDVFNLLPRVIRVITIDPSRPEYYRHSRSLEYGYSNDEDYDVQVAELFKAAGEEIYMKIIVYMIKYIFPSATAYIPDLERDEDSSQMKIIPVSREQLSYSIDDGEDLSDRMARESVLRVYLKQVPLDEIGDYESLDMMLNRFVDAGKLRRYLQSLNDEEFKEIVFRLSNDHPRFRPEHIEPGIIELSNRMLGIYGINGIWTISHITEISMLNTVIIRLLKTPPTVDDDVFLRIFNAIESLSIKSWLVAESQKEGGEFHGFVSNSTLVELKNSLCELIRNTSISSLAEEWFLPRFLLWSKDNCPSECARRDDDPKFTFIVLWGLRSESSSSIINQDVRRFTVPEIDILWENVVKYYGRPSSLLRHRIESMCKYFDQVATWAESKGLPEEFAYRIKDIAEEWLENSDNEEPGERVKD